MRLLLPLLVAGIVGSSVVACYGATEIELQIDTDVPCATVRTSGITIAAGSSLTESNDCTDGASGGRNRIGNLVLVPASGTPDVAIRVVLGVGRITRDCSAAGNADCIVADRRLSYRKHESLKVPIRLDNACSVKQCPEGETCSEGVCISSEVPCASGECAVPPSPPLDAGADDAGGIDIPPVIPTDAGADAGPSCKGCPFCEVTKPYCCRLPDGSFSCARRNECTVNNGSICEL